MSNPEQVAVLEPVFAEYSLVQASRAMFDLDPTAVQTAQTLEERHKDLEEMRREQKIAARAGDLATSNS